jgi:cytochrome P450
MAEHATIVEVPRPPKWRLPFPLLMLRMVGNPVASWAEDFYDEPIVVYHSLGLETAFVMDPDLIQTILLDASETFTKSPIYDHVLGEGGGKGVLIAEGERWKWQRRLLAPLFRPEEIGGYVPAFVSACAPVLSSWSEAKPGTLQDIDKDMTSATLRVLEDTVLGADLSAEDHDLIASAATSFLQPSTWKIAYASLRLPKATPHPGSVRMARASRDLRDVASRALARRRNEGGGGGDLLGRLVTGTDPATGEAMPDSLIVDNMVTFLLAGHETTAKALTWTLYLLALFPEWQERASEEVRRVTGGDAINAEHVKHLPLLETVFQEAMRLYPPAPTLMRRTRERVKLGAYELGEGATIVIPIYVVHRHRILWQDPLRFDPLRFRPEASAGRHRSAYMPFGGGPRTCIGAAFAMMEGKAMLATLLAQTRFELPQGEVPVPLARVTLRPKPGLKLNVTMRR